MDLDVGGIYITAGIISRRRNRHSAVLVREDFLDPVPGWERLQLVISWSRAGHSVILREQVAAI